MIIEEHPFPGYNECIKIVSTTFTIMVAILDFHHENKNLQPYQELGNVYLFQRQNNTIKKSSLHRE